MKPDSTSLYLTFVEVAVQLVLINFASKIESKLLFAAFTYFIGGTITHSLFVLIHDVTHFTCFRNKAANQLVGILANLGQGVPSAVSFGRYHADHHVFLGRPGYDPDLPTQWECGFFTTPIRKFCFLALLPFFYALRPYVVAPKAMSFMEFINLVAVIGWNYFVYQTFGLQGLVYLIGGTLLGMGLNPVSAHIIAEHYEFVKNQDTYDYFGFFNIPNLNLGYHIEHHDFPMIPWTKLPTLRKMAPEFYENLPSHDSYLKVVYKFIFDRDFGVWCRIGRTKGEDVKQKRN